MNNYIPTQLMDKLNTNSSLEDVIAECNTVSQLMCCIDT